MRIRSRKGSTRIVLGKGSGIDNINDGLEQLGIIATEEEKVEILQLVKSASLKKKALVDLDEFRSLVWQIVDHI